MDGNIRCKSCGAVHPIPFKCNYCGVLMKLEINEVFYYFKHKIKLTKKRAKSLNAIFGQIKHNSRLDKEEKKLLLCL